MQIHLIAIGGAAMHNLALALYHNHHTVTGSDDEVYNPAKDRLAKFGLLPKKMGWNPDRIHKELDFIILGMHARIDNPELLRAQELKIPIYSYPEYIYKHARKKKRFVVAGSHGKTTTTSMIMHVLKFHKKDFDYLVGAQLEGFETMVRLSDAPIMVIEGDEYLSSPIDRRPKIHHYRPHVSVITGIAWDHINVFPTFKNYVAQFEIYIKSILRTGKLFYYEGDKNLQKLVKKGIAPKATSAYASFDFETKKGKTILQYEDAHYPLKIFGQHNLENLRAAFLVCKEAGISTAEFFEAIASFKGAAKRLQLLAKNKSVNIFLDFAHAPSKVEATVKALKAQYPDRQLIACVELHTFSSLNKKFHPHYKNTLAPADKAFVYFSEHTLKMKKLPAFKPSELHKHFEHPNLKVLTNSDQLFKQLGKYKWEDKNLLLMTSGTFGGKDLKSLAKNFLKK